MPAQSTFFVSYILNTIILVSLLDLLRVLPLLSYACCAAACATAQRCQGFAGLCCKRCEPDDRSQRESSAGSAADDDDDTPPACTSRQYVLEIYAKLVFVSSIYHVFMIVAPLCAPFACLFFLLALPLYSHILLHVIGAPRSGERVETAGEVWEQAVRYQTFGLLVSQVPLFGM